MIIVPKLPCFFAHIRQNVCFNCLVWIMNRHYNECVSRFVFSMLLKGYKEPEAYRYKKAEGYPRLSFRLSCTSRWKPHAECIRAHICTWCCSRRSDLGRWPWSQTEARLGPHNETTQNLEREKKILIVYTPKKSNGIWGTTESPKRT